MTASDAVRPHGAGGRPLPEIRSELQLVHAGTPAGRADAAVLHDPVRQQYYRLDAATLALLSIWRQCSSAAELALLARARFDLEATEAEVEALAAFLAANQLTVEPQPGGWRQLAAIAQANRHGWLRWAVHNYLFVRIPLLRPEPLLRPLLPWVAPLFTRAALLVLVLLGVIGLHLVSRQWEAFLGTFPFLFSLEGVIVYGVALVLVKSLHELGHAFTAMRHGCRVPTMGVCLMVLVPMLFTDVTDAWRLPDRRQRFAVGAAGLVVETGLAVVATLAWVFLPDGPMRAVAFAVATTGWVLSIGLNLNPLMRFDGYYMLADWLDIENLQPRAFAVGIWRLREVLFGLGVPPPERFPRRQLRWLALYAWLTWCYRLVLFTGIAVTVYLMAFKALGILLFAIEIIYFVALPIWRELVEWHRMRNAIAARRRSLCTAGIGLLALAGLVVPWQGRVAIPAVIEAGDVARVFPPRAARVVAVEARRGAGVEAGDVLLRLEAPELDHELRTTRARLRLVDMRLARRAADAADRADSLVLADTRASLEERLAGLAREQARLVVTAPVAGIVAELDPDLHAGRWLRHTDMVALVRSRSADVVRGYVSEADLARLEPSAPAQFVPESLRSPVRRVRLERVATAGVAALDIPDLASLNGGGIAVRAQERAGEGRSLVPIAGHYLVTARLVEAGAGEQHGLRGTLLAAGRPESVATRVARQVLKVLIRESGS